MASHCACDLLSSPWDYIVSSMGCVVRERNSLLGGGVELVVDAFVLMEKVALWYFVVLVGGSSVSNSSLLSVKNYIEARA